MLFVVLGEDPAAPMRVTLNAPYRRSRTSKPFGSKLHFGFQKPFRVGATNARASLSRAIPARGDSIERARP